MFCAWQLFHFHFQIGLHHSERVNTNSLISVDNSLAMNVFDDLAWKAWMVNTNWMAPTGNSAQYHVAT